MPRTVLDTGDTVMNTTESLSSWSLHPVVGGRRRKNKQKTTVICQWWEGLWGQKKQDKRHSMVEIWVRKAFYELTCEGRNEWAYVHMEEEHDCEGRAYTKALRQGLFVVQEWAEGLQGYSECLRWQVAGNKARMLERGDRRSCRQLTAIQAKWSKPYSRNTSQVLRRESG